MASIPLQTRVFLNPMTLLQNYTIPLPPIHPPKNPLVAQQNPTRGSTDPKGQAQALPLMCV